MLLQKNSQSNDACMMSVASSPKAAVPPNGSCDSRALDRGEVYSCQRILDRLIRFAGSVGRRFTEMWATHLPARKPSSASDDASARHVPQRAVAFVVGALLMASSVTANAQSTTSEPADQSSFVSILDVAPQVYVGIKRYPKFYGDKNMDRDTIDGPILERQYLLGSLGGARDELADHGLVIGAGLTQVVQGAASGDGDGAEYVGSGDVWAVLDTGRARLWSGGLIFGHFEGDWGRTVSGTGALLPLNGDAIMPSSPSSLALSELYLFQALPDEFSLVAGKVNWTAWADKSFFANDERNQFLYEGLINNAVLGAFVPYTSLGGGVFKSLNEELVAGVVVTSNATDAASPGFDKFSASEMTYGFAASWTPTIAGLPGLYDFLIGYSTKSVLNFDIDQQYFINEITGQVPIAQKDDNYALALGGSQYLWVDETARRSDGLPVGIGPFFRFGIVPKDRNLIDQFYSVGIGGNGGLFGRIDDNWGIGWAGTHFSSDLRGNLTSLGIRTNSFENAAEAFYNIALTPAVRISFHLQYIDSANAAKDNSTVLATRLQLDF